VTRSAAVWRTTHGMSRASALLVALAVCAAPAAIAGCGSGGGGSSASDTSGAAAPATTAAAAAAASGGAVQVTMKDIQFAPQKVTVKVGQTVRWTNEDSVVHDVRATSGASFKSDLFAKGKTYEYKPAKPGTIAYVCTIHPGMQGTLTVVR
jgi:plastocyanin